MSTTNPATARSAVTEPSARSRAASPTEDLIAALLGVWLTAGTTIDGWAHSNLLSDLREEGFFTPWHGFLYSGFTATAAWTFWLGFRRRHTTARWWVDGRRSTSWERSARTTAHRVRPVSPRPPSASPATW